MKPSYPRAVLFCMVLVTAAFVAEDGKASEFDLSAYFANARIVAAAIGSNDSRLEKRLLQQIAFVEENGLEKRFTPPDQWKGAVGDLIAGRERKNEYINPFAVWMLLEDVGEKAKPSQVGAPFADLTTLTQYFEARGDRELAGLLKRIDYGNTTEPFAGLPGVLRNKIGETEYPARVSVFTPADAGRLLKLLSVVKDAEQEINAFAWGESSDKATRAEATVRKALTKSWTEHVKANPDGLEGETAEQAVERMVKSELDDPYKFTDAITAFSESVPILTKWLQKAEVGEVEVFFVYESS